MNPWDKTKPILSLEEAKHFKEQGYIVRRQVLSRSTCDLLKQAIEKSIEIDYERNKNKYGYKDYGMVLVSSLR